MFKLALLMLLLGSQSIQQLPVVSQWNVISDLYKTIDNHEYMLFQAATTLGGQLVASSLALRAQQHFEPIWHKYSELEPWKYAASCYLGYTVIQFGFDCALETFLGWTRMGISKQAEDALRSKYTQDESLLKLGSLNQSDTRVHNVFGQFKESIESGLVLQSSGISALTKMGYYLWVMYEYQALSMALWMLAVGQAGTIIPSWVASKIAQLSDDLREINAKVERLQGDLMSAAPAIVSANRTEDIKSELDSLVEQRQSLEGKSRLWGGIFPILKKHMGSIEYVSKYAYIALWAGPYAKAKASSVISSGFEFSRAVAWAADNANDIKKTEQNLHNVKAVIELMQRPVLTPYFYVSLQEDHGLEIIDGSVGVGENTFIQNINLKLSPGRHVLVGKNGKGKSTLLRQIAGQRDHQAWSKGRLHKSGNLIFVPQHEYWMPYQTLAGSLGADIREQACRLVGICRQDWDDVKRDWGKTLSGGECKKLALLAAVLKKPDILILDEIFDGMDPEAIEQSKSLIRSLGPAVTVLIVDHEHEAHNKDGFYDSLTRI